MTSNAIAKRGIARDGDGAEQSISSLSVVPSSNGLTASTSSIAMGTAATIPTIPPSPSHTAGSPSKSTSEATISGRLDFIGTSNAVKKIFSISLDAMSSASSPSSSSVQQQQQQQKSKSKPTLLAIHNFDGTLLIDDAEDESNYDFLNSNSDTVTSDHRNETLDSLDTRQSTTGSTSALLPPSSQSLALALSPAGNHRIDPAQPLPSDSLSILSNFVQSTTAFSTTTSVEESTLNNPKCAEASSPQQQTSSTLLTPPKPPREYIPWKFQDLNMLLGHDALVVRPPTAASSSTEGGIAVRVEDVLFLRSVWEAFQRQQEQQQTQKTLLGSTISGRSYAQALLQERPMKSSDQELTNTDNERTVAETESSPTKTTTISNNDSQKAVSPNKTRDEGDVDDETKKSPSENTFSEVPLKTCIVPFPGPLGGKLSPFESSSLSPHSTNPNTPGTIPPGSSISTTASDSIDSPALSIVLDAYLDNLMANVPQLALCLEEKGLIQSVKLLPTEDIPSKMLHPSTLDTSRPLDVFSSRIPTTDQSGSTTSPQQSRARQNRRHHRRQSSGSKLEESMFSPQIMEMNASALLRFLKTNCTRNHATYLLRHEGIEDAAGDRGTNGKPQQNIQLYDISSISTQKQKKWIWWLATMSYRFALRLRHLETSSESSFHGNVLPESQKRAIRDRQRSLFQQTLDLLQDLMDIDGNAHESMVASVREHIADTYLSSVIGGSGDHADTTAVDGEESRTSSPRKQQSLSEFSSSPPVVTAAISAKGPSSPPPSLGAPLNSPKLPNSENATTITFSDSSSDPESHHRQPYASVSVDALNKAQDHLVRGIKTLSTLLERDKEERRIHRESKKQEAATFKRSRRRQRKQTREVDFSKSGSKGGEEKDDGGKFPRLSPAMVLQLFGMNFKLVNISLRLAEHHLGNYYSSSAMQALRTAARRLNDAVCLLDYYCAGNKENIISEDDEKRMESLQLQYIWLLEHCGHFARSFASDELWRDRGHASGEDVISVLSDVENVFAENHKLIGGSDDEEDGFKKNTSRFWEMAKMDVLLEKSDGKICLQSLSGVVAPFKIKTNKTEEAIDAANAILAKEKLLRRERRKVLVASCISYSRAITAFQFTINIPEQTDQASSEKMILLNLLRQRLGDACNETGKVLLAALRMLLVHNQGGHNKKNNRSQLAAEALLDSAEFWFTQGLEAFSACRDTRNLALLRCNICQSFKLRANSGFSKQDISSSSSSSKHAEDCLQQAADQLMTAHEDLGHRGVDPHTWDMVSEELAATFLVLGVRRRQSLLGSGNAPVIFQVMRLSPGEERSIVDPMERALKIYEQSDNAHQAAAVHYQLALTYSKLWTCQLNESNTRKKLSKAFEHYSSAFNYFSTHSRGNEPTFCLLCLDLASLYAAIPGEEGLMKSLGCCLDCCDTFSIEAIQMSTNNRPTSDAKAKADWYNKMETIAQSIDDRVFKLLRSLAKINPVLYKDMYREGLTAKMVRNVPENDEFDRNPKSSVLLALHEVLLAIKKIYGAIVSKP